MILLQKLTRIPTHSLRKKIVSHLQGMIRCVHFSIVITMYVQGRFFPATTRTETKTEQRRRLALICVAKWGMREGDALCRGREKRSIIQNLFIL